MVGRDSADPDPPCDFPDPVALTDPGRWVGLHGDKLYGFALLRTGNPHVSQDLVQETFLAALKSRQAFGGQSSERTWLVGILKHKLVDHYRKSNREPSSEKDEEEKTDAFDHKGTWRLPPGRWPEMPEKHLENQEFWQVFRACMDRLPLRLRQAFSMRELDDMETAEICKVVGATATNLWTMLHRARARLRSCLEDTWFRTDVEGEP